MQRFITTVACLLFIISCSQQNQPSGGDQRVARVENGLIEFESPAAVFHPDSARLADAKNINERMKYYNVPGVSIAVVHDYKLEWAKAYGVRDINTGEPVTTETIFEAASTSKFITAVMALHFVQQGIIDLDADVNTYLKSWEVPENEFTREEKVTLRRLLTHRAGLPTTNFDYDKSVGYPTLLDVLNGESPALNKPAIPELVPGSQWQYSNVAYDVIQLLLEDVTGKPFQQIAEEMIFKPLGMKNSTFEYPLDSEKAKREAMPHDDEGMSRKPSMNLTALAHAGLTTTPTDLAKFANEIMLSYQGKSETVISQGMARRLLTKEFDLDPKMIGMPLSEGLGVLLMGEGKGLLFTHPGSNLPGLNCWLVGWPERGNGIVVMTNGAKGEILAMEIIPAFILEYNKTKEESS